jgi:hypothetical protein
MVLIPFPIFQSTVVLAAGLDMVPTLTLEGAWDSNVFNDANVELDDYVLRAQPGLTFSIRALDTTLNLHGAVTAEKYMKYHELDRTVADKSLSLTLTDPIRITPNLQIQATAYFFETTSSWHPTVTPPLFSDPGAVQGAPRDLTSTPQRTKEREFAAYLAFNYKPTDKFEAILQSSVLKHEYPEAPPSAVDFGIYRFGTTLYYHFTPKLQIGPSFGYDKSEYDLFASSQVYRESLAVRYFVREGQILELRGGASHSKQDTQPPVTTNAPYGLLSLDSTWGTLRVVADGEYGIVSNGVLATASKRLNGRLRIDKGITPQTRLELATSFQRDWLEGLANSEPVTIHTGSITVRYLLSRWATIRFGGIYFKQTSAGTSAAAGHLQRDSVFLGIDLSESYNLF